ncbi:MAG: hypothetical protein M3Z09_12825 [Acidobacteriota bacterium]|nr:hypothetical protein [Acidobacteriota bacterium]
MATAANCKNSAAAKRLSLHNILPGDSFNVYFACSADHILACPEPSL